MPERTCLATAVDLLARREHSKRELREKLIRKGYDADETDEVIKRLVGDNLLSDERFAESYTRGRAGRGYGPTRIVQELRQKGVSDTIARAAVAEAEDDWITVALRVYRKKFSGIPKDFRDRSKRINFLRYKGFSMDLIAQVMDQN